MRAARAALAARSKPAAPTTASGEIELSLLADLSALIGHAEDAAGTLPSLVDLIADRVRVDVCSLYLREDERLILRATHGLDPASVGRVHMKTSEGLTGLAIEQMKPVAVEEAPAHPRFKYFPETNEELYHSFLGVPLVERGQGLGVLVIQTRRPRRWTRAETLMMATIASQLVGIIRAATLRESLDRAARAPEAPPERGTPQTLRGTPAVPGIARGRAFLFTPRTDLRHLQPEPIKDPSSEMERLARAFDRSIEQVRRLHETIQSRLSPEDAQIFHAHLLFLQDAPFRRKIEAVVGMHQSAGFAIKKVVHGYLAVFEAMTDAFLKERAADIEDVGRRLLENLGEEPLAQGAVIPEGAVVVAPTLDPSLSAYLSTQKAAAVATARGGAGGHGVILARSLGIPTVVGVEGILDRVSPGDEVILDGASGLLFVQPPPEVVREYDRLARRYRSLVHAFDVDVSAPGALADHTRIELTATMGLLSDLDAIHRSGAEGIGLYRTEFLFYALRHLPSEEEQYDFYRRAVDGAKGLSLTIRTLDAGGDKPLPQLQIAREENPALGLRGLRFLREHPELLRTQLTAILRAAAHGPVRVLVPMVTGIEEWRWARAIYREVFDAVRSASGGPAAPPPFGAMVEVPSAIILANDLAREADFLSLGTNDLVQYLLAVDRNNPHVAAQFDPLHPVLLRAIAQVLVAAGRAKTPVSICGEMPGNPLGAPLLVGLGAASLCTDANRVPVLKGLLKELQGPDLRALAREATRLPSAAEVRERVLAYLRGLRNARVDQVLDVLLPARAR
ncbi:MAG: phosphoenolpyruvate--protein phosphotransferase [Planctomycetes bacterium]|nr:phosphoenolpyruvate--protein phosphotransferase [Planctomycetota bacterium]